MPDERLTIGELASRTGLATSALRYWEEFGLLPPAARVSGQRRYPPSAVGLVGMIVLLRDVGFTLDEAKAFLTSRSQGTWHDLAKRKIAELEKRIAHAEAARTALVHALSCPHEDILECPKGTAIVAARLSGTPFEQAHHH